MSRIPFLHGIGASIASAAKEFHNAERAQMGLGGLLGGAGEAAGVLGKSKEAAANQSFSREFNAGDFDSFGGDITPGKWVEIARFRIPADTEYAFGFGSANNPTNQGYIYFDGQSSTPNPAEGTLRFKYESSTGRKARVVNDVSTEKLDASKTNRDSQVPLPEQVGSPTVSEDGFLVLELKASPDNTDQNIDANQSDVIIPVTEYDFS